MKNFFKKWTTSALAAVFCGTMLFSGTAAAAPSDADLAAFEEAMLTPAKPSHHIFREQIIFFTPALKADLDFQAGTKKKDELRMAGSLDIVLTNESGITTPTHIPFYIDQTKKNMTLYFQIGTDWFKIEAPTVSASAVDIAANPEQEDLRQEVTMLKDVKILRETDTQRTMLVTLDSNQLIQYMEQQNAKDTKDAPDKTPLPEAENFFQCIKQGLQDSEIQYTWTIDKQDWQTITLALDLSDFIQASAKAALTAPDAHLSNDAKEILEALAYYSELKAYTTFLEPKDDFLIEIPKDVKKNAASFEQLFTGEKK